MVQLPFEIQKAIVLQLDSDIEKYKDRRTLGSLRLTSRSFLATATPILFETLSVWLSGKSLDDLREASLHKEIWVTPHDRTLGPTVSL